MTAPDAHQVARNGGPAKDLPIHEVTATFDLNDPYALVTAVIEAGQVTITMGPASARHLAEQLDTAAETPTRCDHCHRYVEKPSSLGTLCGTCQEREDGK